MPLLLCRQKARIPFCHDKLNINIWSEQELSFVIYNYPFICMGEFCGERLFGWIESELRMKELADRLRDSLKAGDSVENQLLLILKSCNYYGTAEVMAFRQRMSETARYSESELRHAEGMTLYRLGSYNLACERFEESIKALESDFRRGSRRDDGQLREHNKKKAGLYCDMAAAKLQMFDERGAMELLELSRSIFRNERAETMRYLIDGSGDPGEEKKEALDKRRSEVSAEVRKGERYRKVSEIFSKDKEEMLREARKLVAAWKQEYRHM